jgi:hypothetical protein
MNRVRASLYRLSRVHRTPRGESHTDCARALLLDVMCTVAPILHSLVATARPIPELPPVISATLPVSAVGAPCRQPRKSGMDGTNQSVTNEQQHLNMQRLCGVKGGTPGIQKYNKNGDSSEPHDQWSIQEKEWAMHVQASVRMAHSWIHTEQPRRHTRNPSRQDDKKKTVQMFVTVVVRGRVRLTFFSSHHGSRRYEVRSWNGRVTAATAGSCRGGRQMPHELRLVGARRIQCLKAEATDGLCRETVRVELRNNQQSAPARELAYS